MIRLNIKDAAIRVLIIESLLDQADNNTASLLSQGIDSEWVENLRSLSSRDALRVSHFQNVTMEVTLNEKQLSHAFAQAADERRVRYPDFFGHSSLVNFTNWRTYDTLKNLHTGAS